MKILMNFEIFGIENCYFRVVVTENRVRVMEMVSRAVSSEKSLSGKPSF